MMFDRSITTALCIGGHAMLHVTSFQFRLPRRRNMVYNIIYPEMRWHTTIFGFRALICMVVTIYFPQMKFLNGVVVYSTMVGADLATLHFKQDAASMVVATEPKPLTMMRGNAYPAYVGHRIRRWHNLFYALSQVLATMNMLYYGVDAMFVTLLPIQTAPLFMTLAKKGIISQLWWHILYTATLLMGFARGAITDDRYIPAPTYISLIALFSIGRFKFHINKYILWAVPVAVHWHILRTN